MWLKDYKFVTPLIIILLAHICASLEVISSKECGTKKGCFFKPKGCNPSRTCVFGVSYQRSQDGIGVSFELFVERSTATTQYVAVGFSNDPKMGNDAVTECVYDPSVTIDGTNTSVPKVFLSYNPGKANERLTLPTEDMNKLIHVDETGIMDGFLICRFTQCIDVKSVSTVADKVLPLDKSYYLLLATGTTTGEDGINIHTTDRQQRDFPAITGAQMNVAEEFVVGEEDQKGREREFFYQKTHGILMLLGWWLSIACAILFARYFKGLWPETKPAGLFLWFHFHRGLNIIGVLLTMVGFLFIFLAEGLHIDDFHPIFGLLSCLIAWCQPVGSLFRCKPNDPKRSIFNWGHRLMGLLGLTLATVTIFLATKFASHGLSKNKSGSWPVVAMVIYVAALLGCAVILEVITAVVARTNRTTVVQVRTADNGALQINTGDGGANKDNNTPPVDNKKANARLVVLLMFVFAAFAVIGYLIFLIAKQ